MELLSLTSAQKTAMLELLTHSKIKETYMLPDFEAPAAAVPLFQRLCVLSQDDRHYVRGIYVHSKLVGFLNDVEIKDGSIELGYVIHPDCWNKGYATTALKLAIGQLFDLGYREVITGAFSENTASLRVMEKAGMIRTEATDTIEYRGNQHTCVYYHIQNQTVLSH